MAIPGACVWEIRTTGSTTNGGGFVAGSTGTDYSLQDAPQIAVSNAVANGTTTLTSATAGFGSTHPGNILYLAGGTGSLAATRRNVVSVTNATTIVVDATVATGTAITLNLGGALDHPSTLIGSMVASNRAFVKAGTYTTTGTINLTPGNLLPVRNFPPTTLIGYGTSRGDGGRPTIQLLTSTGLTGLLLTSNGMLLDGFIVDCNGLGTSTGINLAGSYCAIRNCKVMGFTTVGISIATGSTSVYRCEVTGGTAGTAGINHVGTLPIEIDNCWVHDNACPGIVTGGGAGIIGNLVTNNSGATSDGINTLQACTVRNNTVYKSGRHGIVQRSNQCESVVALANILAENAGYGFVANLVGPGMPAALTYDGNAYYANTSGTRLNADDTGTVFPGNGTAPYTNVRDVILTADPFVARAGDDYRLNAVSGGGAACRGMGVPQNWPGNTLTVSAPDFGAVQHVESGGGIGSLVGGGLVS